MRLEIIVNSKSLRNFMHSFSEDLDTVIKVEKSQLKSINSTCICMHRGIGHFNVEKSKIIKYLSVLDSIEEQPIKMIINKACIDLIISF